MANLKLGLIPDEKPVKLTVELPASVHRDLLTYAEALSRETGQKVEPAFIIAPMLARFMSTDREFAKRRKAKLRPAVATFRKGIDAQPPSPERQSENV